MSSLICMAVHDTRDNGRTAFTKQTLDSLCKTVDFNKHQLFISDNGSCRDTHQLYEDLKITFRNRFTENNLTICFNKENIGTARAINAGLFFRRDDQFFIKKDNDCVVHSSGWVDEMEQVMVRDETIGILGLKRKDLAETPNSIVDHYRSELIMLNHRQGEKWLIVEKCKHIMGTCQMLSPKLIERIGYFCQPIGATYAFDDSLLSLRSELAGFINCFLPHIEITHVDPGDTDYTKWKQEQAGLYMADFGRMCDEYRMGIRPIYEDGGFNHD